MIVAVAVEERKVSQVTREYYWSKQSVTEPRSSLFNTARVMDQNLDEELNADRALLTIDEHWYRRTKLKGTHIDILGGFVGTELFILDGDSIVQRVLNDSLLALGRPGDASFQLLHAYYTYEKILADFSTRGANFEVVFFETNRHLSIGTGARTTYETSSRSLVRNILKGYTLQLRPTTRCFTSIHDSKWLEYARAARPMLICCNDGGLLGDIGSNADHLLLQRRFMHEALSQRLHVALLDTVEFKDSKIITFIYESRSGSIHKAEASSFPEHVIPKGVWRACSSSLRHLHSLEPLAPVISTPPVDDQSWLVAAARAYIESFSSSDQRLLPVLYAFLAHVVLLPYLDVADRSLPRCVISSALEEYLVGVFFPTFLPFLNSSVDRVATFRPDLDGRVFTHLLSAIIRSDGDVKSLLGAHLADQLDGIWAKIQPNGPDLKVDILSRHFTATTDAVSPGTSPGRRARVLRFENDILEKYFENIDAEVDSEDEDPFESLCPALTAQSMLLKDAHVWTEGRAVIPAHHITAKEPKPATEKLRQRKLKRDQRLMAQLQRQAGTLTGAKGALLQQQVIASVGTKAPSKPVREKAPIPPKGSGGASGGTGKKAKKEPVLKSADKLRAKIKESKDVKVQSESETWWKTQLTDFAKITSVEGQIARLDGLMRNKKADEDWLAAEMGVYRLHLTCTKWIEDPSREAPEVSTSYRVDLLAQIKDVSIMPGVTPTIRGTLSSLFQALGFATLQLPTNITKPTAEVPDRPYQFKFIKLISKTKGTPVHAFFPIKEEPTLFQLRYFGEHMDRSMDSRPDPRTSFEPDAWQREVLDKIDRDESILVVAPTSAGKTFIGFYAMERVLRESDSGLLIYVAPTKALVTQIAAEVYARYKKDLNGRSCWAVHTRELQLHDAQKTQILVTVPEMLSKMLLDPAFARVWTPRIRRIIFDEIHSISEDEGGAVWEQLLLMAPCPIIGLSATVGNPNDFNKWLGSIQTVHGYKHTLVQHPHRYSHLRKFVYDPDVGADAEFSGLAKRTPGLRLKFVHPISALGFRVQDIPDDLSLESRDCVSLFEAMKAAVGRERYAEIADLDPLLFFKDRENTFFRQKDVLQYESALKAKLQEWMSAVGGSSPDAPAQRVIALLSKSMEPANSEGTNFEMSHQSQHSDLAKLLSDLHHQGDLPAILFNFDRYASEQLAKSLCTTLEDAEAVYRETSADWKQKMKEWERWELGAKTRERDAKSRGKKSKAGRGDDEDGEGGDREDMNDRDAKPIPPNLTNPDDPSPEFTFTSFKQYTREELAKDLDTLSWSGLPQWSIDCLKRGIAVHHSGMNKRYRSLIEGLFRLGFIRVMISSETLALGINAPCKTCVFLGDSPKLTALMFRQCAGRAGRRGFDLLGKVVFFGVSRDKIQRLLLSRLPPLTGQFPLSTTLSLRLLNLLDGSDNAPAAVSAIKGFLEVPRLSVSSNTSQTETAHHLRFSLDYLRRSQMLDESGKALLLSDLAAPLHENEPGNLAFIALLQSGYIHQLCSRFKKDELKTTRELVLVLSHLFSRRYMRKVSETELASLVRTSQSVVDLPSLPMAAEKVLKAHNQKTLDTFSGYTLAYAADAELVQDHVLPLTGPLSSQKSEITVPIVETIRERTIQVTARSAFVANSGHGDDFRSVEDLERTTRPGLHLNKTVIPYLDLASKTSTFSLNAVLYDFFVHGSDETLVLINGIGRGEVWYVLQDFCIVLTTLQTSLEQLFRQGIKDANVDAEAGEQYDVPGQDDDIEDRREYQGDRTANGTVSDVFPQRPPMVPDGDWDIYCSVVSTRNEFEVKFKAFWA